MLWQCWVSNIIFIWDGPPISIIYLSLITWRVKISTNKYIKNYLQYASVNIYIYIYPRYLSNIYIYLSNIYYPRECLSRISLTPFDSQFYYWLSNSKWYLYLLNFSPNHTLFICRLGIIENVFIDGVNEWIYTCKVIG